MSEFDATRIETPRRNIAACPSCRAPISDRPYCPRDGMLVGGGPWLVGGRYMMTELLGSGGMSFVFSARDQQLAQPVAIKILRDEYSRDSTQVRRFLREARLASQLQHENIVQVLDFGRDSELGVVYLVMELLSGETLADVMNRGPLEYSEALTLLGQLCNGLGAAHHSGVIHRDVKPRNVFLCKGTDGKITVKLCDFGLSRLSSGEDRLTVTGAFLGTPAYMAPEQLRGDPDQDARVDIYAFGVITYELLSGQLPFEADTPVALIANKLSTEPRALPDPARLKGAPNVVIKLIGQCLQSDRAARPPTIAAVEQQLLGAEATTTEPALTEMLWSESTETSASSARNDLLGTLLGNWRIEQLLWSGSVSSIFLAKHTLLETKAAIKVLHSGLTTWDDTSERFTLAAKTAAQVPSRHIPRTYDFGQLSDGRLYAVMEYLDGVSLRELSRRERVISVDRLGRLLGQAARALAQVHEAGILHRDLKPENLFIVREDGREVVKILDFWLAKAPATDLTRVGFVVGTAAYCSPEQAAGQDIGNTSDVYALGVIAFELLTGRLPIEGARTSELLSAKTEQDAPSVASVRSDLPGDVVPLVDRMLARDPKRRPATMQEVAQGFDQWRRRRVDSGQHDPLARRSRRTPSPERHRKRTRPRASWPVFVFSVLLGAALVTLILYLRHRPEPSVEAIAPSVAPLTPVASPVELPASGRPTVEPLQHGKKTTQPLSTSSADTSKELLSHPTPIVEKIEAAKTSEPPAPPKAKSKKRERGTRRAPRSIR